MKNITYLFITIFLISAVSTVSAQMNYQAIILDDFGEPLSGTNISVRASVHLNSATGTISYQETQAITTDDYGRLNLSVGNGSSTIGTYSGIPRTGSHFLEVEVDITGGANYTSLSTIEVHPSFKADEIDPIYESSPAASITTTDINNWNNAGSGGGAVITIDNSNYLTEVINNYDMINIHDNLVITSNYFSLDRDRLFVSGGSVSSTNGSEIDFGTHTTVSNVLFSNVNLDGLFITFINCRFEGNIEFPDECNIYGGRFFNCTATTSAVNSRITSIVGVDIDNSTITRVQSVSNCFIDNSTLGESTSNNAHNIHNNEIDDTQIFTSGTFADNVCDDTYLQVRDNLGFLNITGNSFDGLYTGKTIIVQINRATGNANNVARINDNHFWLQSGSSNRAIEVNGNYTGSFDSIVHIESNTFARGGQAIQNNSSNVYIIARDNTIQSTSSGLGITSGAFNILSNNFNIP